MLARSVLLEQVISLDVCVDLSATSHNSVLSRAYSDKSHSLTMGIYTLPSRPSLLAGPRTVTIPVARPLVASSSGVPLLLKYCLRLLDEI